LSQRNGISHRINCSCHFDTYCTNFISFTDCPDYAGRSVFLVLIVELLNTGIETVVNRISTEQHYLSGMAKDAASAAVFVASLNLVFVWGTVLFDLILNNY
jgi:hypothetical protein